MPSQPLKFDYAAIGLACALSRRNANRTVALAVPNDWNGDVRRLAAAVDTSATSRAHSAVVNLVQHMKREGKSTSNIGIYLSARPTNADKGMFIEQVHDNSYLNYVDGGTVYFIRPTHANRHGVPSPAGAPPRHHVSVGVAAITLLNDPRSWFEEVESWDQESVTIRHGGRQYTVPIAGPDRGMMRKFLRVTARVAHVRTHTAPLAGSVPAFALPATADLGSTYTSFSLTGRRFFDSIFAYTAMALVPARLNAVDGAPVSGLQGHNVGAVLASSSASILSWGLNFGQINATLHAEVSLIKAWQTAHGGATPIPPGSRLYTTLEPCFMCAGQIAAYGDVRDFTIIYVQADPKFNPLPTFLEDARLETFTPDDLGLTYRGKGVDWQTRLATTQARLVQHAVGKKKKSYQESAISVLNKEASQARRFAKAAWDLAELGDQITENELLSGNQRGTLLSAWSAAMRLVMLAGGHLPAGTALTRVHLTSYMNRLGVYLDDTAHQNTLRAAAEPAYAARALGQGIVVVNKYQMRALALAERIAID
jgi:tRNA(Arg) A34 adenosine deaminase TadA